MTFADPFEFFTHSRIRRNGCWEWTKAKNKGYGVLRWRGRTASAHRVAWELWHGREAPSHLVVRHKCDNPPCVNPDHLELGTRADNNRDRDSRGRTHRGERTGGAKLTTELVMALRAETDGHAAVARKYALPYGTVYSARMGINWKHLPEGTKPMKLNDKVDQFFQARLGQWVDAGELLGVAGRFGWRTRVSNVRKRFKERGGDIKNRILRVKLGDRYITVSEYRAVIQ